MYSNIAQMWNPFMIGGGPWIWFLILAGLGFLFWSSYKPGGYRRIREDPVEIARMRLARGEISSEEFERIKKTLCET